MRRLLLVKISRLWARLLDDVGLSWGRLWGMEDVLVSICFFDHRTFWQTRRIVAKAQ